MTITTEVMNANCDLHEANMETGASTETLYVLDLGGYSCTFLVQSQQMSKVISVLEDLVKVRVRAVDLQRDYNCKSRYETVIAEDVKSVISIQSYSKGGIFHMESDEVDALEEDFQNLRVKNSEDKVNKS
jgi:hypothetical protein